MDAGLGINLACALFLMFVQTADIDIHFAAGCARVIELSGAVLMDVTVLAKLIGGRELLWADLAFVRALSEVGLFMSLEVRTLNKTLATGPADIRALVPMDSLVLDERREVIEVTGAGIEVADVNSDSFLRDERLANFVLLGDL